MKKWRPTKKQAFDFLYESGYEQGVGINPSVFLLDPKKSDGNGDPYAEINWEIRYRLSGEGK